MHKDTTPGRWFWTYDVLFNHIWSFAGGDDRADIGSTYFQPFLAKSLGQGRMLNLNAESASSS